MSLSSQQIYLVAESVVVICHKRNIDLNNITPKQLEEIYNLTIERVIEVFKTNGFKFIPSLSAYASGNKIVIRLSRFGTPPGGNIMDSLL